MKVFYVYIYFDPRQQSNYNILGETFNYKPVYVGKGKGNRVLMHIKSKSKTKLINLNKHLVKQGLVPCYKILRYFNNEEEAHSLEMELIKELGREDLGLGPLFNLTNGGEGVSGVIVTQEGIEIKRKNTKAFWDSLTLEERKRVGKKSAANRDPYNVSKGSITRKSTRREWSSEFKCDVEARRITGWQESYCNTEEKKEQRKKKCSKASLKRLMFFLTYTKEDGTVESAYLKDLISRGWGKDALEWRIKGKMPFNTPYTVKIDKETIVLTKVEKKPYLIS